MSRYWISWEHPDGAAEGFHCDTAILGAWYSGLGSDYSTVCALLEAENETAAKQYIQDRWPEVKVFRFCELRDDRWLPTATPTNRFPLKSWMTKLAKLHQELTAEEEKSDETPIS